MNLGLYKDLTESQSAGNNQQDMSTCGALHSIGSDLTRMRVRSDVNPSNSMQSEQTTSRIIGHENTPTSKARSNFLTSVYTIRQ